jgi:hypothetical protein
MTLFQRAINEHQIRMRRMAEGLTAFATVGAREEVGWLLRLPLELFASQCLLQFGPVKKKNGANATKEERAEAYYADADFTQLELLRKNANWSGHTADAQERADKISDLEDRVSKSQFNLSRKHPWHGKPAADAIKEAIVVRREAMGPDNLAGYDGFIAVHIDFLHAGLHGSSFSGRFLVEDRGSDGPYLTDNRDARNPSPAVFAVNLAIMSLEMVAWEYDELPLIKAMTQQALSEVEADPDRFVSFFPTATVHRRFGLVD